MFIYSQPHIHIQKIAAAAASSIQQRKFTKIKQIKQEKGWFKENNNNNEPGAETMLRANARARKRIYANKWMEKNKTKIQEREKIVCRHFLLGVCAVRFDYFLSSLVDFLLLLLLLSFHHAFIFQFFALQRYNCHLSIIILFLITSIIHFWDWPMAVYKCANEKDTNPFAIPNFEYRNDIPQSVFYWQCNNNLKLEPKLMEAIFLWPFVLSIRRS